MGIKCFVNFDRAGETEIGDSIRGYKNGRIDAVICDIAQNGGDRTLIDRFISNPEQSCKEQWIDFIIFVYQSYMKYQPESINNIQPITYIDDSISIDSIYGAAHGIKIPFTLSDKTHSLLGIFNDSKFVVDGENHYTNFFYGAPSIYVLADMFGFKNNLASELICRIYHEQQSRYVYSNLMKENSSKPLKKKTADILRKMIKFSQQYKYCYENDILEKWPDFPYYIEGDDFRLLSKHIKSILGKKFIKACESWFQIELIHDDIKMCNFYLRGKRRDEFCIPLDVNYPLSKANGLPASSTSQPTISTGVNSGCTSPICILLSYAICRNPSAKIFFAALMSLSCHAPQTGHIHSLTDKSFVSSLFWYQ